mmetsp:Transcript_48044/g.94912  ORF Transcript_48044/g.94912 Transcript_48044/m.94912 type:complete len:121 (+) Transcript_48044:667-1029(+)
MDEFRPRAGVAKEKEKKSTAGTALAYFMKAVNRWIDLQGRHLKSLTELVAHAQTSQRDTRRSFTEKQTWGGANMPHPVSFCPCIHSNLSLIMRDRQRAWDVESIGSAGLEELVELERSSK